MIFGRWGLWARFPLTQAALLYCLLTGSQSAASAKCTFGSASDPTQRDCECADFAGGDFNPPWNVPGLRFRVSVYGLGSSVWV